MHDGSGLAVDTYQVCELSDLVPRVGQYLAARVFRFQGPDVLLVDQVYFCVMNVSVMELLLELVQGMFEFLADAFVVFSVWFAHGDAQCGRVEGT